MARRSKRRKTKSRKRGRRLSARQRRAVRRRRSSYIRAGRPGHVKRGCGKRNWRRGGNARWKCKVGKTHAYRR